jgi:hypothetical protein
VVLLSDEVDVTTRRYERVDAASSARRAIAISLPGDRLGAAIHLATDAPRKRAR